jgi:hypothetical protein
MRPCNLHFKNYCFYFIFKMFLLAYDSCTGGVVTFPYVYMLHPRLLHPLHYFLSSSTPLPKMTLADFNVPYLYMYRKYLNHIHYLLPSSFPSSSHCFTFLIMTCFTFLSIVLVSVHCSVGFGLVFYL